MLQEVVENKFGDFSKCRESHVNHWESAVLGGKISRMKFGLDRMLGDVASLLSVKYRLVEKGMPIRNFKSFIAADSDFFI